MHELLDPQRTPISLDCTTLSAKILLSERFSFREPYWTRPFFLPKLYEMGNVFLSVLK